MSVMSRLDKNDWKSARVNALSYLIAKRAINLGAAVDDDGPVRGESKGQLRRQSKYLP